MSAPALAARSAIKPQKTQPLRAAPRSINCAQRGTDNSQLFDCGIGTGMHEDHHAERDDYL
jgi:hypothetical protein